MFIVRNLLGVLVIVFIIITKVWTTEIKNLFDFLFESEVEGISSWLKTSDSIHVEKSGGYHSTTQLKGFGSNRPKSKGLK